MDIDKEVMRSIGYQAVDLLVEHFETLRSKPAARSVPRSDLELLREPIPDTPTDPAELLAELERNVFTNITHVDHPRFFAFVPSPGNFASVIADFLATGHNVFAGTWLGAAAASEIELTTIDWLRQILELPETWGGLFTSGGSVANLSALATAREVRGANPSDATVYLSDQTHSSVHQALRVLGFRSDQICEIPSDSDLRLDLDSLQQAIQRDRESGRAPLAIVANAGTTNSGAVDPLQELGRITDSEGLWLHVDAAYGGAAALCEQGKRSLAGLHHAHSITLDPHKWLFQPFDSGCLLVRDVGWLEETFSSRPAYLLDAAARGGEVNHSDRGIELTRPFRALKLWMTFKVFGIERISTAIQQGFELAEFAESVIEDQPHWKIVTPAQLGVVTFRIEPPGLSETEVDAVNRAMPQAMANDGFAFMSTTELFGRPVCRFCTINPRSTARDIEETIHSMNRLALDLPG